MNDMHGFEQKASKYFLESIMKKYSVTGLSITSEGM